MVMALPLFVSRWSSWSVTVIREAWPASASSTELSSTSQIRWWRPSGPVDPMSRGGGKLCVCNDG